ncbi:MAG: polysaccharide deacetylase family protein [Acetatifactor sp.]
MELWKRLVRLTILLLCLVGLLCYAIWLENPDREKAAETLGAGVQEVDGAPRRVALTFDDGPHPYYTEQLLDGLKERGVKATFFVTGEHAKLHPDVIQRMYEEGHLIGNHTYSHIQLRKNNQEAFREELIRTNEVIGEITGGEVLYVRPPYGSWDKSFEKELNMIPVLWTIDPLDWCSHDASCVADKVLKKVKENDIILLHDCYDTTVEAAFQIVDELKGKGYLFVTVEELLFD